MAKSKNSAEHLGNTWKGNVRKSIFFRVSVEDSSFLVRYDIKSGSVACANAEQKQFLLRNRSMIFSDRLAFFKHQSTIRSLIMEQSEIKMEKENQETSPMSEEKRAREKLLDLVNSMTISTDKHDFINGMLIAKLCGLTKEEFFQRFVFDPFSDGVDPR